MYALPKRTTVTAAGTLVLAFFCTALNAQRPGGPSPKTVEAVRLHDNVTVDGQLDDAAWRRARFASDFQQKEPVQFATPEDRTEVAFLYDDDALYIGLRMWSREPSKIPHDVTRRDQYGNSEHIVVSLDPFHDRRTAYSFSITAGGVRRDYYHPKDARASAIAISPTIRSGKRGPASIPPGGPRRCGSPSPSSG